MKEFNIKAVLPVIHVESLDQAIRNINTCISAGADGCFLINHVISREELITIAKECRRLFPDYWLGINDLSVRAVDDLGDLLFLDGLWTDQAFNLFDSFKYDGLYFGGVAFKYQPIEKDLKGACEAAITSMNVVTTSGPSTGFAPEIKKIREMREYLGSHILAIASGLDFVNVVDYIYDADIFMLSSSICKNDENIDLTALEAFISTVRRYSE
jgi:hypothetical protein